MNVFTFQSLELVETPVNRSWMRNILAPVLLVTRPPPMLVHSRFITRCFQLSISTKRCHKLAKSSLDLNNCLFSVLRHFVRGTAGKELVPIKKCRKLARPANVRQPRPVVITSANTFCQGEGESPSKYPSNKMLTFDSAYVKPSRGNLRNK